MIDKELAEEYAEHNQGKYTNEFGNLYHAYSAGYKAGRQEWHDLRKNPDDLPKKEQLGQTFVVALAYNEQTQKYYCFDCAEYIDKGRFITHTVDASNENNAYKIIAWKEII